jgi:hypothetical protein
MPVDSPDGTGGLINILCYKSNNFAGDFVSHFNIDIETCEQCGGAVKVICILILGKMTFYFTYTLLAINNGL